MKKIIYLSFLFPITLSFFISIFFIPFSNFNINFSNLKPFHSNAYSHTQTFIWPTPNYTYITSPFGYRKSPTNRGK